MDDAELIAEYDRLLAVEPDLGPDLLARLRQEMRALDLVYADRELGVALRPHFLTRRRYEELATAARTVLGALEKVTAAAVAEPRIATELGLDELERRLVAVDPGYEPAVLHARLDAFVGEGRVRLRRVQRGEPVRPERPARPQPRAVPAARAARARVPPSAAAVRSARPAHGRGRARLARLGRQGPAEDRDRRLGRRADRAGVRAAAQPVRGTRMPAIVCAPEELEYEHGKLRRGEFVIDVSCFKRVIIRELLERLGEGQPLVRAYVARDVCVVNSLRCTVAHRKAAFALLTDERSAAWFTPLEAETIARCVPWTRRLREGNTSHRGRTIDLLPYVRAHRADFVLKPSDSYGGRGVVLGSALDASGWDSALERCSRGDHVVQQALRPQVLEFPIFDANGWAMRPMHVDTDPFVIDGHVEGAMVRLSDSPIVNVTAGGGETGFLVLEREPAEGPRDRAPRGAGAGSARA
jgi:hypothetical protein